MGAGIGIGGARGVTDKVGIALGLLAGWTDTVIIGNGKVGLGGSGNLGSVVDFCSTIGGTLGGISDCTVVGGCVARLRI